MDIMQKIFDFFSQVPEWAYLYLVPALIAGAAVGFVFTKKRMWFFAAAAFLGAFGFSSAYANDASQAFVYTGILVALCALLSLLFLIPVPRAKAGKREKRRSREERIYEKFHEELSEKPYSRPSMPPKVCCFEREREDGATAEEYGMSLSYAYTLLEKLRSKKLNAGDRLETEELNRRLDLYREKQLDETERSTLNDCLASILKLTAKYQL